MEKEMVKASPSEGVLDETVYLKYSLRKLSLITVILPMSSLVICFVTANIFQKDDIHETHCKMKKLILGKMLT
ncbi:hypothetical protein RUM44_007811 [Polyplax serrata]